MKVTCSGIYDIHCHIIYNVDDGSKSIEQSESMLQIAYNEGIRNIILTPHYNKRYWDVPQEVIESHYKKLVEIAENKYDDLKLYLGTEIFYSEGTLEELDQKVIPTMAGSKYVLIEFMTDIPYKKLKKAVMNILQRDYIPIVAHVERYECIFAEPWLVEELIDLGAYIQVNAESVTGKRGYTVKKMIKGLLKGGCVHFIATDAHRDDKRQPFLKDAYVYVAKKFGLDVADRIFKENPEHVVKDEYIEE